MICDKCANIDKECEFCYKADHFKPNKKQTKGWHGEPQRHSEVARKSRKKIELDTVLRSSMQKKYTLSDAKRIGDIVGVDWKLTSVQEFQIGLNIELEHGRSGGKDTNVTDDDDRLTGMITLAHIKEFPDYYHTKKGLPAMEKRLNK